MTKKDLKTGMLVQVGKGGVYMYINGVLVDSTGHLVMNNYDESLIRMTINHKWDIVKVSKVITGCYLSPSFWTERKLNENLLWERDQTPEYTMDEAIAKMGHEFKIKK